MIIIISARRVLVYSSNQSKMNRTYAKKAVSKQRTYLASFNKQPLGEVLLITGPEKASVRRSNAYKNLKF